MGNKLTNHINHLNEEKLEEITNKTNYIPQISADDSMIKSSPNNNTKLYIVLLNKDPIGYFKDLYSKSENKSMIEVLKETIRMKYGFDFSKNYFMQMKYSLENDYYKIIVSSTEKNIFTSYEKIEDVIEIYPIDNLNP